ncbi:MAG: calcium-binding protein [Armatimonadota bacterium]
MEKDNAREARIENEVIVDAYGPEEQAMGWHVYLEDHISFPFKARCIAKHTISPLEIDEQVNVVDMAPEDDCMHDMFVIIEWQGRRMGVPLSQLEPLRVDEETKTAVEDWHYWIARGHQLV